MITLKDCRWGWVFSYGDNNELSLDQHQIVQLVGKNGHGKSSIPLILEELLFNKNSKGTKRANVLNRYGKSKTYWIEGTFNKDGDEYTVKVVRPTGGVKLTKNGTDISSHTSTNTYKTIEEVLGFDQKTFSQLIYQSSAASLEFLTATDTNRKKFLISLLNLDVYVQAFEIFKEQSKVVSDSLGKLETKAATISSWIETNSKMELTKKDLVDVPDSHEFDKYMEEVTLSNESLKTIEQKNKRITQNNKYKELLAEIPVHEIARNITPPQDTTEIVEERAILNNTVQSAKKLISKFGSLSDTCPTCKQPVDNSQAKAVVVEQEQLISATLVRLNELELLCEGIEKDRKVYNRIVKYKEDYENYHSLIDPTVQDTLLDKDNIENRVKLLNAEIASIKDRILSAQAENNKRSAHNSKVDVIVEQMESMQVDLNTVEVDLSKVSHNLSILQLLQKTFSTNGLIAYKIECLVKDLESLTNEYLAELSGGRFQISFQVSSSDKLNVIVTDSGLDIDILDLSNGERARVNTATLLAIRKLMQKLSNTRINLLILDETIDSLDTEGKEKLVEVLLNEEHLNTILISHGYSHPLLEKISVVKENKISRIE